MTDFGSSVLGEDGGGKDVNNRFKVCLLEGDLDPINNNKLCMGPIESWAADRRPNKGLFQLKFQL